MRVTIICKQCGNSREVFPSEADMKFCSGKCYGLTKKKPFFKGKKHSAEAKTKMSLHHIPFIGDKNHIWTGENAGYGTLHMWVRSHLGSASLCEEKDTSCIGRFEWANISGEYKRSLSDWRQLCRSHHIRFDKNNGTWGKAKEIFELKNNQLAARRLICV